MDMIEKFKKQHFETYQKATIEIVKNNTKALVEGDILPLVKTPPLDSMDTIKSKLLSLAKKEKVVLDAEQLKDVLSHYRNKLSESLLTLDSLRETAIEDKINSFQPQKENDIIKLRQKDLDVINKEIKNYVKKSLEDCIEYLLQGISTIYSTDIDEKTKDTIHANFKKYMKSTYEKQMMESIFIKLLVKDRTLMSGIIEQGERYLFTKENSHIFDDQLKSVTE